MFGDSFLPYKAQQFIKELVSGNVFLIAVKESARLVRPLSSTLADSFLPYKAQQFIPTHPHPTRMERLTS